MLKALTEHLRINVRPRRRPLDYREAVGGLWDELGQLQFNFMRGQGLGPHHVLLDIGCGSLRGGRHFIPYLKAGHYFGLDADEQLVWEGFEKEGVDAGRRPEFAFNDCFELSFSKQPDFALAQSVFTHLTAAQIALCLRNLRGLAPDCRLYATFFEAPFPIPRLFPAHPQRNFLYTPGELARLASKTGWLFRLIGEWGHPRGQQMAVFYSTRSSKLYSASSGGDAAGAGHRPRSASHNPP